MLDGLACVGGVALVKVKTSVVVVEEEYGCGARKAGTRVIRPWSHGVRILMHPRFSDLQDFTDEPWHRDTLRGTAMWRCRSRPEPYRQQSASSIDDEPPPKHHSSLKGDPIAQKVPAPLPGALDPSRNR
jgi:hypothetical protein